MLLRLRTTELNGQTSSKYLNNQLFLLTHSWLVCSCFPQPLFAQKELFTRYWNYRDNTTFPSSRSSGSGLLWFFFLKKIKIHKYDHSHFRQFVFYGSLELFLPIRREGNGITDGAGDVAFLVQHFFFPASYLSCFLFYIM